MSESGKANYEAYRKAAGGVLVVGDEVNPEYGQLPANMRHGFDAGADAVEAWTADLPVDEDMPRDAPDETPTVRYALVEQMGHRATTGTVRETTFLGEPMLEVTDLVGGDRVHLVSPKSLYEITWLTETEARQQVKPWTAVALPGGHAVDPWHDDDDERDEQRAAQASDADEYADAGDDL